MLPGTINIFYSIEESTASWTL